MFNKIYFTSGGKSPSYQYTECMLRKNYKCKEINLGIFMCKKIFSFHAESLEKNKCVVIIYFKISNNLFDVMDGKISRFLPQMFVESDLTLY